MRDTYNLGRTRNTNTTTPSTPATSGRARYDRFTRTEGSRGTTRFVRVDGDRSSPVIDLTDAARPQVPRTVVPRLAGSRGLSENRGVDSRRGSARFTPRTPVKQGVEVSRQASRIRTKPVTRDSIMNRYRGPSTADARGASRTATPGKTTATRGTTNPRTDARATPSSRIANARLAGKGQSDARTSARNAGNGQRDVRSAGNAARGKGTGERAISPERAKGLARETRGRVEAGRAKIASKNPGLVTKLDKAGLAAAKYSDVALRTGINAGLAITGAGIGVGVGFYDNDFATPNYGVGIGYGYGNYCAYGTWGLGLAFNTWLPWTGLCYPTWNNFCYPYWYGYGSRCFGLSPFYYSSGFCGFCGFFGGYWGGGFYGGGGGFFIDDDAYEDGYDDGYDSGFTSGVAYADDNVQVVQEGEAVLASGQGAVNGTSTIPSSSQITREALSRAAAHYLTVGDQAFQQNRFGDAVHFYAKAIEFAPDEGVLYLILSDALFATGDYHYAAYALRKSLELDPSVVEMIADKHAFYTDPKEFDRQLAVLETFLQDHYTDDDARLLLAANYLFGNRPAAAVDLLESPFSKTVAESPAGQLLLGAAKSIQHGTPKTE